jgi:hypothetical protein
MQAIARHHDGSLEQVLAAVQAELHSYAGAEVRRDDTTIVALAPRLA